MNPVSPTHSQVAEHSFDRIVMHLDTTILQEHLEGLLVIKYIIDCSLNHCTIRRIKLDLLQQLHQLANYRCTVLKSKSASLLSCMLAYLRLSLYLEEVVHHQDDYTHTMVRDISIHEAMAGMEPASCTHQSHFLHILLNCLIQDCSVCSKHPYTRVLEDGIFLHTVTTATLLIFHHTKLGFHGEGSMDVLHIVLKLIFLTLTTANHDS